MYQKNYVVTPQVISMSKWGGVKRIKEKVLATGRINLSKSIPFIKIIKYIIYFCVLKFNIRESSEK